MKPAVKNIIGKEITGVFVREASSWQYRPQTQLFLIFSDGTYYEFYSDSNITGAGGVDKGGIEEVKKYMPKHFKIIAEYSIKDVGS